MTPTPKPGGSVEAREIAEDIRRRCDAAEWNPTLAYEALDLVDTLLTQQSQGRAEIERLRLQITAALRELERASDVRNNRTGIIGNTHILLQAALAASPGKGAEGAA